MRIYCVRCSKCGKELERDSSEVLFADADRLGWVTNGTGRMVCLGCDLAKAEKPAEVMQSFLQKAAK